ncbi:MAG: hypothetical protein ACXW3Z_11685 [Limisphaerales bacterium]
MANRPTQLNTFLIVTLVFLLSLSFVTGIGLWYVHEQRESPGSDLPQWTNACRILHGVVNPAICAVFGFLWFNHIRGGWKMRVNRKSGGSLTAIIIVLIASGVGLYYADEARHFWFTVHLIPGLLLAFVLPAHWFAARKWVRTLESNGATKLNDKCSTVNTPP